MLKEYKINEEILNKKIKSMQCLEQEVSNAKNKNKKIDLQVNRKDKLIQHLKEKTKTIGIEKE